MKLIGKQQATHGLQKTQTEVVIYLRPLCFPSASWSVKKLCI